MIRDGAFHAVEALVRSPARRVLGIRRPFGDDTVAYFTQGKARVQGRIDLGIGSHEFHLELPDVDMVPASYRGERGVEVRLPLFERRW